MKHSLTLSTFPSVQDPMSAIYGMIRDCSSQADSPVVRSVSFSPPPLSPNVIWRRLTTCHNNSEDDVLAKVLAKGYTQSQLEDCLREYEELNIWCYDPDKRIIRFT